MPSEMPKSRIDLLIERLQELDRTLEIPATIQGDDAKSALEQQLSQAQESMEAISNEHNTLGNTNPFTEQSYEEEMGNIKIKILAIKGLITTYNRPEPSQPITTPPAPEPQEELDDYSRALTALKTESEKPEHAWNTALKKLIEEVEALKSIGSEKTELLTTVLSKTQERLTRPITEQNYIRYASTLQGNPSPGQKALGGLMIALSVLVSIVELCNPFSWIILLPELIDGLTSLNTRSQNSPTGIVGVGPVSRSIADYGNSFFSHQLSKTMLDAAQPKPDDENIPPSQSTNT